MNISHQNQKFGRFADLRVWIGGMAHATVRKVASPESFLFFFMGDDGP